MTDLRPDPGSELRRAALELFARDGYGATSLQDVAARVGYTKANVLYHFGTKQGLLEAAVGPVVEEFEAIASAPTPITRAEWVEWSDRLVLFMLANHDAVSIFINQVVALRDQPMITRVNSLIFALDSATPPVGGTADARGTMRRHMAIAGAAYFIAKRRTAPIGSSVDGIDDEAFAELVRASVRDIVATETPVVTAVAGGR